MSKKPTKADLEKHIEKLERDVRREQEIKSCLLEDGFKRDLVHKQEMKKSRASRKRLSNRLKNVYDLSMVLKEIPGDGARNRVLNTLTRIASGR